MRTIFQSAASALLLFALASPATADLRNQLGGNASPYLEMHAKDPTAWQAWSRQSVELARKQNKLLFVSIGYFSCHWCHVMQRESYRNPEIAAYINKHFIPVKVDREIEPALDAHMIAFADRSLGYSGWPLNVFLTPEGYPLYATVYLPPKDFLQLLQKLQGLWKQDSENLAKLAAAEQAGGNGPGKPVVQTALAKELTAKAETVALQLGSPMTGGFGDANRFPFATQLEFLLERERTGSNPQLRRFLRLTLDSMARYGLRDHLAGGFFRYTVDPNWRTPHFEKMLYDNAQLAMVYMKAGTVFNDSGYKQVARSTLDFMQRDMRHASGAMIASFSAIDDKGVEGGYYLWDKAELRQLLTADEWRAYRLYAGMVDPSPLDQGYLPMQMKSMDEVAKALRLPARKVRSLVDSARQKMLARRSARSLPRDNKRLASWNGLALAAFSIAAKEFPDATYHQTAQGIRDYLVTMLWDGKQLVRARENGEVVGQVSLEDYAAVARGLLEWARLTGKEGDYRIARDVVEQGWKRFYTRHGWRMSEPGFIPMESPVDAIIDDHLPSPSGLLLEVSYRLAARLDDKALRERALAAANSGQQLLTEQPFWYVSHIQALMQPLAAR